MFNAYEAIISLSVHIVTTHTHTTGLEDEDHNINLRSLNETHISMVNQREYKEHIFIYLYQCHF